MRDEGLLELRITHYALRIMKYALRITHYALLTTIVLLSGIVPAMAQDDIARQKAEINKIKKDNDYIYAEATLPNQQQAIDLAQDILYQNINEYVAKKRSFAGAGQVVTVNTNYVTEKITLPRGNMYRAFLYVDKDDIIPASNVAVSNTSSTTTPVKVGTPTKALEEKKPQPETNSKGTATKTNRNAVISQLLQLKNFQEAKTRLKQMKSDGQIAAYDMYQELSSPADYLLIVFDAQGSIKALLSEGSKRTNLQTSRVDDLKKYKGCGAIGVKIKN